ncbi:hypothetical protein HBZ99_005183 [Salmonella enterica subsp. enterica]|nr:hypothetical protein [Salmonella enterica]EAB6034527.1 hypothetical protein [Salmonella enterica subsp. enterica serovar Java]EBI0041567.1 hypothetical protein [Salmonella enterica subsp. diarizonae serovar 61:k:z35]ECD9255349.1 hypothetical protein [Salmonella enterica subsp. diarizonae]ECT8551393.1 hypothetical protein [Salmonella enterica subsp. diarizonae serovar 48:i:z]EEP4266617.1 hypothetical protein [Salmonella enterica subsp. enterica serovar Oranienburg]ESG62762.1 hypothetical pr
MPDGVTGTDFQTKDLDRECEFYEISSDRRLLRWQDNGELKDTLFDGMLTVTANGGYHLHFMQGKLQWIEVYSQGDKRWPFDPERYLADQG